MLEPSVQISSDSGHDGKEFTPAACFLTVGIVPGHPLEQLVQENDRQRELHDCDPLCESQGSDLEHNLKREKELAFDFQKNWGKLGNWKKNSRNDNDTK